MARIAKFMKVSYPQFSKAVGEDTEDLKKIWYDIQLPARATAGSAGYDFRMPFDMVFEAGEARVIPTGIRACIDEGWVLVCVPRSGLGFKKHEQLDNTVGVIDSDYFYSDNEGHIMCKIRFDERTILKKGDRFVQGIFLPYGLTCDDDVSVQRNGGMGSTGK